MKNFRAEILITLLGALLFLPFLGDVHLFDWDEVNFAEMAREIVVTGEWLQMKIDFKPFWEKPPLFIWLLALSMKVFGVNEFAARLPNAILGILALVTLYRIGKQELSERMGWYWMLMYSSSLLSSMYFKTALIDPLFNFLMLLGYWNIYLFFKHGRTSNSIYAGMFVGLAVLAKGPVALLLVGGAALITLFLDRQKKNGSVVGIVSGLFVFGVVASSWFVVESIVHGTWFVEQFVSYQIGLFTNPTAGHAGPFYYHFIVLLFGCFPASVLMIPSIRSGLHREGGIALWMLILAAWIILIFSITTTKIVHYSSMAWYPITFLAAWSICKVLDGEWSFKKAEVILIAIIGGVLGIAISLIPFVGMNLSAIIPYVKDPFAVENMKAAVVWTGSESIAGLILCAGVALFVLLNAKRRHSMSIIALSISAMVAIQLALILVVPKVEAYSQRAAIEFFKQRQNEDVYVAALGYKSYAHLFYSKKQEISNSKSNDLNWLLRGEIDKAVYFVAKVHRLEAYRKYNLEELGRSNGFVFLKRAP